jgi:hypothetical protein
MNPSQNKGIEKNKRKPLIERFEDPYLTYKEV